MNIGALGAAIGIGAGMPFGVRAPDAAMR